MQPLAPERYRVQFTIGQETRDRLRRVQDLLRREVPNGDPAILFDRALRLLEDAERRKRGLGTTMMSAAEAKARRTRGDRNYEKRIRSGTDESPTERPRQEEEKEPTAGDELRRVRGESEEEVGPQPTVPAASRHIPNAVKAAVWRRDRGQCAFVSDGGHRCTQRSFLELHHLRPYALAGRATARNIALRCRRHNQYEGELVVVIGKRCKRVSEAEALDYVFGYTIGNDVSERAWQRGDRTLWRGKNTDTFKPMGPWIVTGLDPDDLHVTIRLNGKTASTSSRRRASSRGRIGMTSWRRTARTGGSGSAPRTGRTSGTRCRSSGRPRTAIT